MATTALVTGAAGFIGSHVVRALAARGVRVRALHQRNEDLRNLRGAGPLVERAPGDVTDARGMRAACEGVDLVFHLAAVYALWTPDPERMWRVNVEGTRVVLAAARDARVRRVVVTSSIARFGGQGRGRRGDEQSRFALGETGDLYARSKADAHEVAVAAAFAGQDVVIVAPTGPIGPGDVGPTPTGRLLLSTVTQPLTVLVPSVSNFAHVEDMATGHLLAAEHGRRGESYLLGGDDLELVELAKKAHAVTGVARPIVAVPYGVARAAAHVAVAWSEHVSRRAPLFTPAAVRIAELGLAARCDKARHELGYAPRPLEAALRDAFAWWAREGYLGSGALAERLRAAAASS